MTAQDDNRLQAGERQGIYEVIDPGGYAGTLPTARILSGHPNAGLVVNLTSPFRRPE